MDTPPAHKQCTMCGKPASEMCKQCRSSHYCSRACQVADWPTHKLLCRSFTNFTTPPNPTSKLGIFFPDNSKVPRFVWVKCSWKTLDEETYQHVDKAEFLGSRSTDRVWVQLNKTRHRKRQDVLTVHIRSTGAIDGSALNQCVIAVAGGRCVNYCWPGPLLVLRTSGLTLGDSELVDVDMVDFRDAVDLLCSYPDININTTEPEEVREVQGVRINCQGEMELYGRPKYETVMVEKNNKVFTQPVTSISQCLGLPVTALRCSVYKATDGYDRTNEEVVFLHMNAIPSSERWGWASAEWQLPTGNVIVVRDDRKPMEKEHVEAMCRYCLDVLTPLFEKSMEMLIPRKVVLEKLTKNAFEEYWKGYNMSKWLNRNDETWKVVDSPV